MRFETCTYHGKFDVALADQLTSAHFGDFRELLSRIKESKCNLILIDLKNLDWIDSAGLSCGSM